MGQAVPGLVTTDTACGHDEAKALPIALHRVPPWVHSRRTVPGAAARVATHQGKMLSQSSASGCLSEAAVLVALSSTARKILRLTWSIDWSIDKSY
ncbi:MAG: hypothetical protein ACREYC_23320 [Gammaproteobacteria bacterium]